MIKKANKKNLAGRFLVAGFFVLLFISSLLIIKPAKAVLDISVYNKAATSTLTAVEWNNLLTDFISTLGGRIDGPLSINTATSSSYALDIVGSIRATNLSGSFSGFLNSSNVTAGDFGSNSGGGNYTFPGNVGVGTTNTGAKLFLKDINAQSLRDGNTALRIENTNASGAAGITGGQITFAQPYLTGNPLLARTGAIRGIKTQASGNYGGGVQLLYNPTGDVDMAAGLTVSHLGNVGIGTTTPVNKLQIGGNGSVGYSNNLFVAGDATTAYAIRLTSGVIEHYSSGDTSFLTGVTERMRINSSGNVGIGITNPTSVLYTLGGSTSTPLHTLKAPVGMDTDYWQMINGAGSKIAYIDKYGSFALNGMIIVGSGASINGAGNGINLYRNEANASPVAVISNNNAGSTGDILQLKNNIATVLTVRQNGNVGIGTTTPTTAKLVVSPSGAYSIDALGGRVGNITSVLDTDAASVAYVKAVIAGTSTIPTVGYWTANGTHVYNANSGGVAIGTTTPGAYKLYVNGNTNINGVLTATTFSGAYSGTINSANVSAGNFAANTGGGNFSFPGSLGIGTTTPTAKLDIFDTSGAVGKASLSLMENAGQPGTSFGSNITLGRPGAAHSWVLTNSGADDFQIASNISPWTRYFTILSGGNVGIGLTNPGAKLSVNGNLLIGTEGGTRAVISGGSISEYYSADVNPRWTAGRDSVVGGVAGFTMRNGNYGDLSIQTSGVGFGAVSGGTGSLGLFTTDGVSLVERMRINSSGNVGIGTTTPGAYRLYVNGNTNIAGSLTATTISGSYSGTINSANVSAGEFGANTGGGNFIVGSTVSGNLGVGLTPTAKLHVYRNDATYAVNLADSYNRSALTVRPSNAGTETITTSRGVSVIQLQAVGTDAATAYNLALNPFGGNVGIGRTNPSQKLHVEGVSAAEAQLLSYEVNAPQIVLNHSAAGWGLIQNNAAGKWSLGYNGATSFDSLGTSVLTWTNGGNIGIGTTTPTAKLHVVDGTGELKFQNVSQANLTVTGVNASMLLNTTSGGLPVIAMQASGVTNALISADSNGFGISTSWTTPQFSILKSGNVGIGTTTPNTAKLVIVPSGTYAIDAGGARIGPITSSLDTDAASVAYVKAVVAGTSTIPTVGYWTANGTNISNANTGNVGIGTAAPNIKLDVNGDIGNGIRLGANAHDVGNRGTTNFGRFPQSEFVGMSAITESFNGGNGGLISFSTWGMNVASSREVMRIDEYGNVGIGTTTPGAYKLFVNGDTNIVGNLNVTSTVTANNFSGALAGTVSSANVSAGDFGSNTGGGNYSFPGNLGIGTTNNTQRLVVNGNIIQPYDNVSYSIGNNQDVGITKKAGFGGKFTFGSANTFIIAQSNAANINATNTFTDKLTLDGTGNLTVTGSIRAGGDNAMIGGLANDNLAIIKKSGEPQSVIAAGLNTPIRFVNWSTGTLNGNIASGSMTERMRIDGSTGNVGIGTTTPGAYKLFVNGDTNIVGNINVTGTITGGGAYTGTINAGNVSSGAFASNTGGGNFTFPGNVGIGAATPATAFQLSYSDAAASLAGGLTILNYASVNGLYAGIRLSTYGDATGGNYPKQFIGAVRTGSSGFGDIVFMNRNAADTSVVLPGDERMRITSAGNVGIGSTNPTLGKLQVNGNVVIDGAGGLLGYNGSGTHLYSLTRQDGVQNASLSISAYGGLGFTGGETGGPEATNYHMFLNNTGSLGIGTTTPTEAKLVINAGVGMALKAYGNGVFTGTLQTQTGSDFAEEFATTADLEAGTVVVMDDNGYKSVKPSTSSYDKTVVGIVSNNPSIIAGRIESEHKAIIAMMGVVKVKVTSSNGRIHKGDMLTTADKTGYAMKVDEFKPGTVIGKALEDLTTKNGEINVLVNLQ